MFGKMIGGGGYHSARDGMAQPLDQMAGSLGGAINPAQNPKTQPRALGGLFGAIQGGQGMGNPMGGAPFGFGGMMSQGGQGGQSPMLQLLLGKLMGGGIR